MAKMNSIITRGKPPPAPGTCNQNANPLVSPDHVPDKIVSTAKSIPYNEIDDEIPD